MSYYVGSAGYENGGTDERRGDLSENLVTLDLNRKFQNEFFYVADLKTNKPTIFATSAY